jgi:hypothetical protein
MQVDEEARRKLLPRHPTFQTPTKKTPFFNEIDEGRFYVSDVVSPLIEGFK